MLACVQMSFCQQSDIAQVDEFTDRLTCTCTVASEFGFDSWWKVLLKPGQLKHEHNARCEAQRAMNVPSSDLFWGAQQCLVACMQAGRPAGQLACVPCCKGGEVKRSQVKCRAVPCRAVPCRAVPCGAYRVCPSVSVCLSVCLSVSVRLHAFLSLSLALSLSLSLTSSLRLCVCVFYILHTAKIYRYIHLCAWLMGPSGVSHVRFIEEGLDTGPLWSAKVSYYLESKDVVGRSKRRHSGRKICLDQALVPRRACRHLSPKLCFVAKPCILKTNNLRRTQGT